MESIDVRDLPEPVARAIQEMVDRMRGFYVAGMNNGERTLEPLPSKPSRVLTPLTREEIYGGHI